MGRKPSVFDQLSALDALTGDTANDQETASSQRWPKADAAPAPAPVAPAAASGNDMNAAIVAMLSEIRRDIDTLKHEQPAMAPRRPQQPSENELFGTLADLKRDIERLRYEQAAVHVPSSGEQQLYSMLAELRHDIGTLQGQTAAVAPRQAARAAEAFGSPRVSADTWAAQRTMLGLLTAAVLMIGVPLVYLTWKNVSPSAQPGGASVVASAPVGSSVIGSSLFDSLAAGDVSPKGIDARGTVPANALARATGAERNSDEAAYWLKRYIAGPLGDDRLRRALTQLGSIYAEPAGQAAPDYEKARGLWEMASAAGDPIAMCFMGQLYENGLGVTASLPAAGVWYERARQTGGCPGIDDMIARTKKK